MAEKEKIGLIKSFSNIQSFIIDNIEKKVLDPNEVLVEASPASFNAIYSDVISDLGANTFYEVNYLKEEMSLSTAKSKSSIIRYLGDYGKYDTIEKEIFAKPANIDIAFAMRISDMIQYFPINPAEPTGKDREMYINKSIEFRIRDNASFRPKHDIKIVLKRLRNPANTNEYLFADDDTDMRGYSFYSYYTNDRHIQYSTDTGVEIIKEDPFISSSIQLVDGEYYFIMYLNVEEKLTTVWYENLVGFNVKYDFEYFYSGKLVGFEAYKRLPGSDENTIETWEKLRGYAAGVYSARCYNFELKEYPNGNKSIVFEFSQDPDYDNGNGLYNLKRNDQLMFRIMSTNGADSNFDIKGDWRNEYTLYDVIPNQDSRYSEEAGLENINIRSALMQSGTKNGKNDFTIEELRERCIRRYDKKLIHLSDIESFVKNEYGIVAKKEQHDIDKLTFIGYQNLKGTNGSIINSIMGPIDIKAQAERNRSFILLSPKEVFQYIDGKIKIVDRTDEEDWVENRDITMMEYLKNYNYLNNKEDYRFFFPFTVYLSNDLDKNIMDLTVFDFYKDEELVPQFNYFNSESPFGLGIRNLKLTRDPSKDSDDYKVTFSITSADTQFLNTIINDNLEDDSDPLQIFLKVKSASESRWYSKTRTKLTPKPQGDYIVNRETNTIDVTMTIPADEVVDIINLEGVETDETQRLKDLEIRISVGNTDKDPDYDSFEDSKIRNYREEIVNYFLPRFSDANNFIGQISAVFSVSKVSFYENITRFFTLPFVMKSNTNYEAYVRNAEYALIEETGLTENNGSLDLQQPDKIVSYIGSQGELVDEEDKLKIPSISTKSDPDISGRYVIQEKDKNDFTINQDTVVKNEDMETVFYSYLLQNVPLIDIVYLTKNNRDIYMDAISKIKRDCEEITGFFPTLVTMTMGFFNNLGSGGYNYVNSANSTESELDNLNLSIGLGIKIKSDLRESVSEETIIGYVKDQVTKFINDNSFKDEIAFSTMINEIELNVAQIEYCELYYINNYGRSTLSLVDIERPVKPEKPSKPVESDYPMIILNPDGSIKETITLEDAVKAYNSQMEQYIQDMDNYYINLDDYNIKIQTIKSHENVRVWGLKRIVDVKNRESYAVSVKTVIDMDRSDILNGDVYFESDIDVKVIK
jgi:hypothetical protein